jgi:hypothetical protein
MIQAPNWSLSRLFVWPLNIHLLSTDYYSVVDDAFTSFFLDKISFFLKAVGKISWVVELRSLVRDTYRL